MAEAKELRRQLIQAVRPIWGSQSIGVRDKLSNEARASGYADCLAKCFHEGHVPISECYRKCAEEKGISDRYYSVWH